MSGALVWVLVGVTLIIFELFTASFIAVSMGVGATITGVGMYAGLLNSPSSQVLCFSFISVGLLFVLRKRFKSVFKGSELVSDESSASGAGLVGQRATVKGTFTSMNRDVPVYAGCVELNGVNWAASSDTPLNDGQNVNVESVNGLTLYVSPRELNVGVRFKAVD